MGVIEPSPSPARKPPRIKEKVYVVGPSSSERMRVYLNFIVVSSLSGAAAGPQHFKTIHLKYTFCRGGCQSDSAERISSGKYAPCTKKGCIFGNFAFLTFFAKIG